MDVLIFAAGVIIFALVVALLKPYGKRAKITWKQDQKRIRKIAERAQDHAIMDSDDS